MIKKDYYEVLRVARNAGEATIKKAYRQMALKYHPDKNPGDKEAEERFKEAAEAYEVLRDPEKRRLYDQFGHEGLKSTGFNGFSGFEDVFSSFSDIFEDIFSFGSRRSRGGGRRGSDLRYDLQISFMEAAFGSSRQIDIDVMANCEACGGSGAKPGSGPEICAHCGGRGQVAQSRGFFTISTTCPVCRGQGKVIRDACSACRGEGRVPETSKVSVKIPAGVDDGSRLRLEGKGEAGTQGGPAGDLYIVIHVEQHELFEREGDDILLRLPISFVQAALGATIDVPTLKGSTKLKISRGTQSGEIFKLKGEGVPNVRGYGRGDLIIQVIVKIPKKLTRKQEELLREFAEAGGSGVGEEFNPLKKVKDYMKKNIKI
ncbi:molecular chaperone DnaJ [Thermodesulfobacteriota bacterium]